MNPSRHIAVAIVTVASLALTACGDDDDAPVCGDNVTYRNICHATVARCTQVIQGPCGFKGFFGNEWQNWYGNLNKQQAYLIGSAPDR